MGPARSYWKGESSLDDLLKVSAEVEKAAWSLQAKSGACWLLHEHLIAAAAMLAWQVQAARLIAVGAGCGAVARPPGGRVRRCGADWAGRHAVRPGARHHLLSGPGAAALPGAAPAARS